MVKPRQGSHGLSLPFTIFIQQKKKSHINTLFSPLCLLLSLVLFFWIINCIKILRKSNSLLKDRYACWVHTQLSLRNYKKYRDILNSTKLDGLPSSTNSQER